MSTIKRSSANYSLIYEDLSRVGCTYLKRWRIKDEEKKFRPYFRSLLTFGFTIRTTVSRLNYFKTLVVKSEK